VQKYAANKYIRAYLDENDCWGGEKSNIQKEKFGKIITNRWGKKGKEGSKLR